MLYPYHIHQCIHHHINMLSCVGLFACKLSMMEQRAILKIWIMFGEIGVIEGIGYKKGLIDVY